MADFTKTLETPVNGLKRGTLFAKRYEIIEELGHGGMGKVYRVYDKKLEGEIALKLIRPEIATDKKTIERFRNELKLAREIAHRNVCRMYDLNEEEGSYYITMEYIPGEDLKSLIKRVRHLPAETAITIAKQTCEGLSEAHRLGIVHRDLKPSNIMIDKEGNVRIMDFGIARSLKTKGITGQGVMIGTPEYMSPEQVESKEIDFRSDIYSLGVILYEMVTGKMPFEGDTPLSIAMKHKSESPRDPKKLKTQIPDDLNQLILKCLAKGKESRYQSTQELYSELERVEQKIPAADKVTPQKKPHASKEITVTFGLKKLFLPVLIFIGIIAAGIIVWQVFLQQEVSPAPIGKPSVAVLPFENLSPDPEQEYFCEGVAWSILNALSGIKELRVPGKTSSFSFKGKERNFKDIGEKLNVATVLEGSVQKMGERILITTQLTRVADETLLWSEQYNQIEEDIFSIQDQIAISVANQLKVQLLDIEQAQQAQRDTKNPEAYKAYLKGRYHIERRTESDLKRAAQYFEEAIKLDPNYGKAYSGLAYFYNLFPFYGNVRTKDYRPREKELLSKALEIDERDAEAHTMLAMILCNDEWDWIGAEKEYKLAIEFNPNYALAHGWYCSLLASLGRIDEALKELELAQELEPLSPLYFTMGAYFYFAREYDISLEILHKGLDLDPNYAPIHYNLGGNYLQRGKVEEAIIAFQKAVEFSGQGSMYKAGLGHAYAVAGRKEEALKIWKDLEQLYKRTYVPGFHMAILATGLDKIDKALEYVERSFTEKDNALYLWINDPRLDPLRSNPLFQRQVSQLNFPD